MKISKSKKLKERRTFGIGDMRGVDLSSSPFDISPSRAFRMKNLIRENGVTVKREGWSERFRLNGEVLGMYLYECSERRDLLVAVGGEDSGIFRICSPLDKVAEAELLMRVDIEKTPQFFFSGGRCYIVTGSDYLVYATYDGGESYDLKSVADTDVYIPTTSIIAYSASSFFEGVNMLTPWRKNRFEANTELERGEMWRGLDGRVTITHGAEGRTIRFSDKNGYIRATDDFKVTITELDGREVECESCYYYEGGDYMDEESVNARTYGCVYFKEISTGSTSGEHRIRGRVMEMDKGRNSSIGFYGSVSSAVLLFKHLGEDKSDGVRRCSIGCLFGTDGNNDRLFLSGNEDSPNLLRYSESDDFTYFPEGNAITIGSAQVPVMGFSRLTDGALAVFKKKNHHESTIYYLTGTYKTSYGSEGEITDSNAIFPVTAGSIGEGCASNSASCNFAGDSLILSDSGVYGIVLSNNLTTNLRYSRERSYSIAAALKGKSMENAVAAVFNDRYYLCVDGACYVADANYRYYKENDSGDSYNYDWWVWDNIPARCLYVMDGRLWFGTKDGRICVFDGEFTDRTRTWLSGGELTACREGMVLSDEILEMLDEEDTICLEGSYDHSLGENEPVYALVGKGTLCNSSFVELKVSGNALDMLYEGVRIMLEYTHGERPGGFYTVNYADRGESALRLTADGSAQAFDGEVLIYQRVDGIELCVKKGGELDDDGNPLVTLCLPHTEAPLEIKPTSGLLKGRVTKYANIVSEWTTPYFDMGTNMHGKTIHSFTVIGDGNGGEPAIGYETRNSRGELDEAARGAMSFESFSFERLSFDGGFAVSNTIRKRVRDFNFIRFSFLSKGKGPCSFYGMSVIYSVNKLNRGNR